MGHFDSMWIRRAGDTFEAGYIYLVEYFNWSRYVKNIFKKILSSKFGKGGSKNKLDKTNAWQYLLIEQMEITYLSKTFDSIQH